jgi:ATP-dependent RNA helicase RhlE
MNNNDSKERIVRFDDLGLSNDLVKILTRLGFKTPTPIQEKSIPLALKGEDVIGIAQTGTGKTLAFFLPMLQKLEKEKGTGLIVVPTRELAHQVRDEIDKVGGHLGFKTALLIGGANMERQIRTLKRGPHVIVATPGRIIDHIERRTVRLDQVRVLVLDEADRMLDMGFAPQINKILKVVPANRQTLLFSATMPPEISKMANGYMKSPSRVEVARAGTSAENIEQGVYYVETSNKFRLLQDLLDEYKHGSVLVFCRTKHGTRKMARVLNQEGYRSEELHSNRTLNQRRGALDNFKKGKSKVMVATDVASRGIDVKEISLVVNYDIPDKNEDYVHRIGRTGRAGHSGRAVSFVTLSQHSEVKAIERLLGIDIDVLEAPGTLTISEVEKMAGRFSQRSSGGNRRGGRTSNGRRRGARPQSRRPSRHSRSRR